MLVEFTFLRQNDCSENSICAEVPYFVMDDYVGFYVSNGHLYVQYDGNTSEVYDDGYTCEVYKNVSVYDCGNGYDSFNNLTPYFHVEL